MDARAPSRARGLQRYGRRKHGETLEIGDQLGDPPCGAKALDACSENLVVTPIGREHESDANGLVGPPPLGLPACAQAARRCTVRI